MTFDLADIPEDQRGKVVQNMHLVAEVLADGQVTMEEASQLMAFACPELAEPLGPVLAAADLAVKALRDDGKVSILEGLGILSALMAGFPFTRGLKENAKAVASRILRLRGK
ncbi:MAG: hypothetical protein ACH37Z_12200 [Anaerolineae bacterium]